MTARRSSESSKRRRCSRAASASAVGLTLAVAGISTVWASGSGGPAFTALPASGATQLQTPREGAAATALHDGQVLIAGGHMPGSYLATAELFNPHIHRPPGVRRHRADHPALGARGRDAARRTGADRR
jgi:hypothetical protein